MMIFAGVCLVVAVVAAVGLIRTRIRSGELDDERRTALDERDVLASELVAARGQVHAARRERDDAHERVQRARRDSADMANRMRDESSARAEAQAVADAATERCAELERELAAATGRCRDLQGALDAATGRCCDLEDELDEARARPAAAAPDGAAGDVAGSIEILWALTLARIERTWQTSISLGLDAESPLETSADPLRTAVEIEIDAAREEAGADIELHWTGHRRVPPATALVILTVVESVVASVAKSAWSTEVHVTVSDADVELRFDALDAAAEFFVVDVPPALSEAPNQIRIPLHGGIPIPQGEK